MNKSILHIALPAIVANITVPLLGIIDTGISGHLGKTEYIGAISVGTMMFNIIYWNFGFLRMGTSGITAQAYGSRDFAQAATTLVRAVSLALLIALAIIVLQFPIQWIALLHPKFMHSHNAISTFVCGMHLPYSPLWQYMAGFLECRIPHDQCIFQ